MSLYHAYRPQTFATIVGQDHIKQTLQAAVARGVVAHAYLFSGPRGIGKTSIARILAMAINCEKRSAKKSEDGSKKSGVASAEPCGDCSSCQAVRDGNDLNVVEIDAASNRGIDEIRALKEAVGYRPTDGLRKIYIIDEVHMLTKEAFNALLKTLEEPPEHAIFILATTELGRVPDTIISRTQHFTFKRATIVDTRMHLQTIAAGEGLTLSDEATLLIALHADGAFRDALSLLDQLASLGEKIITAEHVRLLLGVAPEAELLQLLGATLDGKTDVIHAKLDRFGEHGYDPAALADAMIGVLRRVLWATYGVTDEQGSELAVQFAAKHSQSRPSAQIIALIEGLITAKQQLRWSPLPMLPLELALLPIQELSIPKHQVPNNIQIPKSNTQATSSVIASPRSQAEAKSPPQRDPANGVGQSGEIATAPSTPAQSDNSAVKPKTVALKNPQQTWSNVLAAIRPKNAQLAALLKSSTLLSIESGVCTIQVPFSFYADRVKDRKNATVLSEALKAETGVSCVVACTISGEVSNHQLVVSGEDAPRTQDELAADVSAIFGLVEAPSGTN